MITYQDQCINFTYLLPTSEENISCTIILAAHKRNEDLVLPPICCLALGLTLYLRFLKMYRLDQICASQTFFNAKISLIKVKILHLPPVTILLSLSSVILSVQNYWILLSLVFMPALKICCEQTLYCKDSHLTW